MKKQLLTLALALIMAPLAAQVVLTEAYFPVAGDTLRTDVADSTYAAGLDVGPAGANREFYFGDPVVARERSQPVEATNGAGPFPLATSIIRERNTVNYYRITPTAFELVGIEAEVPLVDSFVLSQVVLPPRPERFNNFEYEDSEFVNLRYAVTVSPDSLPAATLALFGTVVNNVDSIRVTTISTRNDLADAWGTARLGDNFYDVLRVKRTETVFIQVEVKIGFLPFTDVTAVLQSAQPDIAHFLGTQPTTETFYYWNPESKEAIAEITTLQADGSITGATFKRPQTSTSTRGPVFARAEMTVYPNPAVELATFRIEGLERGEYVLTVINMLGREISRQTFSPFGDRTRLTLNVGPLPAGLYLCNLRNATGRSLGTKKLRVR